MWDDGSAKVTQRLEQLDALKKVRPPRGQLDGCPHWIQYATAQRNPTTEEETHPPSRAAVFPASVTAFAAAAAVANANRGNGGNNNSIADEEAAVWRPLTGHAG